MAIVLGIVLIAAPIGLERYSNYIEEQTWVVTATHLSTVSEGARRYVKDNYDTLLNQVKGGGNVTVTGQTLRDKGYLPAGFSLTNNNGQTYILAVTRNPSQTDKLVAFVLTAGGQNITFKGQRYIAQNTSGLGVYRTRQCCQRRRRWLAGQPDEYGAKWTEWTPGRLPDVRCIGRWG